MSAPQDLDDANDRLRSLLPVAVPGGEVSLADTSAPLRVDAGRLILALRTVTRDDDVVVDLREQEIALGRFDAWPPARWQAYLEGTLRAAPAIVASYGGLDALLPCDIFAYTQVLDDATLASADDFAAALGDPQQLAAWNQQLDDDAWRERLEPCGLADRLAEVKALLRPALRLRLDALEDGDDAEDEDEQDQDDEGDAEDAGDELELGGTRLGGDPDLPPELPWPSVAGEPMVFVAQLDLRELSSFHAAAELPRDGLLSFFYAPFPPEGQVLEHPVAVLHLREPSALSRRLAPDPRARLRPHAITFEPEALLPALESSFCFEVLRPAAEVKAFYESLARGHAERPPIDHAALAELVSERSLCDFERPVHRLLGHPASIQGDPYLDVEMSRRGWDGWREGTDEALALRERALGWRLLLQVDAYQDDELLLEQDGGFFYFWIPADALAAHDFGRAQGCLQCH
jgi:hypothetical protein